jgi:hypothetical protein
MFWDMDLGSIFTEMRYTFYSLVRHAKENTEPLIF